MPTVTQNVSSLMTPKPVVVDWRASLDEAHRILQRFPFRHLPVVERETLVGVVSDHDLFLTSMVLERESGRSRRSLRALYESCPVGDVVQGPPVVVHPDDTHARAVGLMLEHRIDALPVTSDGRLVGIVTSTDLLDAFVDLCLERGSAVDAPVSRYARKALSSLRLDHLVRDAVDAIDAELGHALALGEDEVVGVVSVRDLRLGLVRELKGDPTNGRPLRLGDVLTNTTAPVEPSSRLSRAALRMVADEVGALPVARARLPAGLVTRTEILRHYSSVL